MIMFHTTIEGRFRSRVTISLTSRRDRSKRYGESTIKLKGGQWPDKVSLRFQDKDEKAKPGLEHIRITTDHLYAEGSHHLSGNFPFFFLDAKGKKPFEVIDDRRASGRLKILVERHDGTVDVTLPTNLLAGSSQLHVYWIGWYTK